MNPSRPRNRFDMGACFDCRFSNQVSYNRTSRGVAQPGSASALGAEGRGFKSLRPDQIFNHFRPLQSPSAKARAMLTIEGGLQIH